MRLKVHVKREKRRIKYTKIYCFTEKANGIEYKTWNIKKDDEIKNKDQ